MTADFERWFERTWTEREELVWDLYGPSQPPGAPPGHVLAFSDAVRRARPAACAYAFPPSDDARRTQRSTWTHVTHGLTQPLEPDAKATGRSGYGWELAVESERPGGWEPQLLQLLAEEVIEGVQYGSGHRVAFCFAEQAGGGLVPYLGLPEHHGVAPSGVLRWLLLFPHLRPWTELACETGAFAILVGTGLTSDEFELLDDVGRCGYHLQLLLCERGVGQVTAPGRDSVLRSPAGRRAWRRIRGLSPDEAWGELVSRFARRPGPDDTWPFEDAPNTCVFTVGSVLDRSVDIQYASRDPDDGAWQFLGPGGAVGEPKLVSLSQIVRLDPSLRELAALPPGWAATRAGASARWIWRAKGADAVE